MKALNLVTLAPIIVGGLNWGLVGLFEWNLVDFIFGSGSVLSRIVYVVVGASALWQIGDILSHARQPDLERA